MTISLSDKLYSALTNPDVDKIDEAVDKFAEDVKALLKDKLRRDNNGKGSLRLSQIGTCPRKVWFSVNEPEKAEDFRPNVLLKFLFGDIIEHIVLLLLRIAGVEVRDTQKEVEVDGVKGHIDAIVDNVLLDVKSASSLSFKKFEEGLTEDKDPFGYLYQLCAYAVALDEDVGAFLAVDKQHGHVVVDVHQFTEEDKERVRRRISYLKEIVECQEPPPVPEENNPIPEGKSGNLKLCTTCSYCNFKKACWPELRTFLYARGPVHLVKVEKEPNVPEVINDVS